MTVPPADTSTRLAIDRTRLAHERTLMAWIRTSTSLIAFGFTIFKFFEYLSSAEELNRKVLSPWLVGMLMIVLGIIALAVASAQHFSEMKALRAEAGPLPRSLAGFMAVLMTVLGIVALLVVALRI